MVTHMSRKRRSKRHMKRYSKHSKTHITRNMYRKKHKKTQRGGGPLKPEHFKAGPEGSIPTKVVMPTPAGPAMPNRADPAMPTRAGFPWYLTNRVYRTEKHMPIPDKDVMPADFLPEGWKRIYSEEDHRPFILTPGCSSVYTPGSKKLTDILEYYYRTSTHSKVPPKLPTSHESPKSHESSKSSAPPKSSTSHKSPKSPKSSKSS